MAVPRVLFDFQKVPALSVTFFKKGVWTKCLFAKKKGKNEIDRCRRVFQLFEKRGYTERFQAFARAKMTPFALVKRSIGFQNAREKLKMYLPKGYFLLIF